MTTFTQEIETENRVPACSTLDTFIENTIQFHRQGRDEIASYALQHYDGVEQLHVIVLGSDLDALEVKEEIQLTYAEARILRSFLNRRDIVEKLSQ